MKRILSFLIVILFTIAACAQADKSKTQVQGLMDRIFYNYAQLSKYLISEDKFRDAKSEPEIKSILKDMKETAVEAQKQHQIKHPLMKISSEVLNTHFVDAERAFNTGHKSYARWMMNSSLSICMSCHIQVDKANQPFEDMFKQNAFPEIFDQAELRFVLRNYDKALVMYDKMIKEFPKNKLPVDKLETVFKRKIAILARVKRNPSEAIASLSKDLGNKEIPKYLQKNVEAWISLFRIWKNDKHDIDLNKATDDDILKFTEKAMKGGLWEKMQDAENPKMVTYLRVSGVLYDYFQKNPKTKIAPDILYYLAKCDKGLNNNFFYSLAELYLKECMIQYPTSKIAKKCFLEYEDIIESSFTGSAGLEIPDDVKDELKKFSDMINK